MSKWKAINPHSTCSHAIQTVNLLHALIKHVGPPHPI